MIERLTKDNYDFQQQQDIESMLTLINRNEQIVKHLSIENYRISDQLLTDLISTRIDINYLSINCEKLSFESVINLLRSQKSLICLNLYECHFYTNQSIGEISFTSGVLKLRIAKSQINSIIGRLVKFAFSFSIIFCECFATTYPNCKTCNDFAFKALATILTIKKLRFHCFENGSSLMDTIQIHKNLNKIEMILSFRNERIG